jgi:D-alanyl-D-alanine carboxypeptidase
VLRVPRFVPALATALVVVTCVAGCVPAGPSDAAPSSSSPTRTASATPSTPSPTSTAPVEEPPAEQTQPPPGAIVTPSFDKSAMSIDDPASLWVVSDKLRPLNPVDWTPPDIIDVPVKSQNPPRMRQVAGDALVQMFAASVAEGAGEMQVQSAWRSYDVQVRVYNGWVSSLGQAQADAQSARPGFSEHQTGLSVDISPVPLSCALDACFGATPQGRWLADNAWRFGYLLRYPADKTPVTGFTYEPWHFRYIGVELATEMHNTGVTTLEEFFGLPAAPDYAQG